ncbi:hypothetical protein BT96DRAFT_999835 [Gymnopus androsaceus JB14]|uniref:F-box domain-containing protein n=1 Tax=Gymnopus androsaceus JB14 TaxID=1447944 RepID=A0A6A4H5Q1_9AGAR|nr:hypothetical protein BT96DRAFT_999835 [Gymnopus androsaceus JB14]
MPLPDQFATELLLESLSYLDMASLSACSKVCQFWSGPAKSLILREVNLADPIQRSHIQYRPQYRSFIRSIISPVNVSVQIHQFLIPDSPPRLLQIRRIALYDSPIGITSTMPTFLLTFRATLQSFILHDHIDITAEGFVNLLHALGQCIQLNHLTLPCPRWTAQAPSLSISAVNGAQRPRISSLHIISTSSRYYGRWGNMLEPGASNWQWLSPSVCPFNLDSVTELALGSPAAAELLLPIICVDYGTSMLSFLELRLSSLVWNTFLGVYLRLPQFILPTIRAPGLRRIVIEWKSPFSPQQLYFQAAFQKFNHQVSTLAPNQAFPPLLSEIWLESKESYANHPIEWAEWYWKVFPLLRRRGVAFSFKVAAPVHIPS